MIKVCHMTSAHKSNDTRIFEKECTSLACKKEYEVYLVAQGDTAQKNNVKIVGIGNAASGRISRMFLTSAKIYRAALALDADIYHFHDPELLRFAMKLKKKGKIVIFDSHEFVREQIKGKTYIPRGLRGIISRLYGIRERRIASKLDAVITVTPHQYDYFKTINEKTYMVTNFPKITPENCDAKMEHGKIIFAGGVDEQWSHEAIVTAIQKVNDVTYHIYGRSDQAYIDKLLRIDEENKAVYHGAHPFAHVQKEIKSANMGMAICQYSDNSNWKAGTLGNTKLFESMNLGVPVIATDFDLWKGIVETGKCGICVTPDDVEAIAEAVRYLFENPEIARQMGDNGRELVRNTYNWSTQEKILFQLYETVCS